MKAGQSHSRSHSQTSQPSSQVIQPLVTSLKRQHIDLPDNPGSWRRVVKLSGSLDALLFSGKGILEHLPMLDQDKSFSRLFRRIVSRVENTFLLLVGLKVHNLTRRLELIRLVFKSKIKGRYLISKLGLVVFSQGQQVLAMTTNCDLSQGYPSNIICCRLKLMTMPKASMMGRPISIGVSPLMMNAWANPKVLLGKLALVQPND